MFVVRLVLIVVFACPSLIALAQGTPAKAPPGANKTAPASVTPASVPGKPAVPVPAVAPAQSPALAPTASPAGSVDSSEQPALNAPKAGKAKRVKKAKTPRPPAQETTRIEPDLTYRGAALTMQKDSVFHKEEHKDFLDQLYLTLRFTKSYDFRHDVVIEPSIRTMRDNPDKLETIIEQVYIRTQPTDFLVLTAGKKAEYEGSGFVLNPSDLLNEDKDFFDPLYQRQGKVFTRVTGKFGLFSSSVGFIPMRPGFVKEGRAWLQFSADVFESEIRLQQTFHETDKATTGLSLSRFFGESFELHYDGRYQTHQRSAAKQRELEFSSYKYEDRSLFFVAGSRCVVTNKRTIILEGVQNQSGLMPLEFEKFYTRLFSEGSDRERDPDNRLLGRHYGFLSFQDEDSVPKTLLSTSVLVNADDKSIYTSLQAKHTLSPLTSIELAPTFFRGGQYTEFGEMPFSNMVYVVFRGRF